MTVEIEVDLQGKPMPVVRFYRGGRELREDSRTSMASDKDLGKASLEVRRIRSTEEAKYTVTLEQDGSVTDTATFTVFIKGLLTIIRHLFRLEICQSRQYFFAY